MKGISIFNLIIGFLSLYIFNGNKPIHSSTFILNCKGNIPKKTACIIKASSFKLSVRRIDICQKNPFPNYKVTTDFNGAKCINLLSNKVSAKNHLDGNKKYYISKDLNISQGEYKYISIILENKFLVSGKYKANNYFWTTSKEGPKNIIQSKNDISIPTKYLTKLTNWRGKKDTNNKYCENNGGTPSRCDIQYNGYKMSAIGLDSDFIATSGEKTKLEISLEYKPATIVIPDQVESTCTARLDGKSMGTIAQLKYKLSISDPSQKHDLELNCPQTGMHQHAIPSLTPGASFPLPSSQK